MRSIRPKLILLRSCFFEYIETIFQFLFGDELIFWVQTPMVVVGADLEVKNLESGYCSTDNLLEVHNDVHANREDELKVDHRLGVGRPSSVDISELGVTLLCTLCTIEESDGQCAQCAKCVQMASTVSGTYFTCQCVEACIQSKETELWGY